MLFIFKFNYLPKNKFTLGLEVSYINTLDVISLVLKVKIAPLSEKTSSNINKIYGKKLNKFSSLGSFPQKNSKHSPSVFKI